MQHPDFSLGRADAWRCGQAWKEAAVAEFKDKKVGLAVLGKGVKDFGSQRWEEAGHLALGLREIDRVHLMPDTKWKGI